MRLYLDDERPTPAGFDVRTSTVEETLAWLETGRVRFISLDHDLGTERTGTDVANFIEAGAHDGTLPRLEWAVHSANPVGRARMEAALRSADRFWAR